MDVAAAFLDGAEFFMRETAFFAATGFFVLGLSDLAVDSIWLSLRLRQPPLRLVAGRGGGGRIAVFIPAWDEGAVIGPMLRYALAAWGQGDWLIYVGCYPNDPATAAAVEAVEDERVRLVCGWNAGPTSKADCLNRLWAAALADEAAEGRPIKAVLLHDAEDVVHSGEIALVDRLLDEADFVQLPVLPLIDRGAVWVSGHYADEFAEAHGKELVVRQALGAALPAAGVGCAFSRAALAKLAAGSADGLPFDSSSITEDYETGLKLRAAGASQLFARGTAGSGLIATRAYFPGTFRAAVNQKARWVAGIALSGWDRLGWRSGLAERWMRLRDRQSVLAALLLLCGYLSFALWLLVEAGETALGRAAAPLSPLLQLMLRINLALVGWRLFVRFCFTSGAYGWREGLRSAPRALVSNAVAIAAAGKALARYRAARRTGSAWWGKTDHVFPAEVPAE
jgi:adsorption protein B